MVTEDKNLKCAVKDSNCCVKSEGGRGEGGQERGAKMNCVLQAIGLLPLQ